MRTFIIIFGVLFILVFIGLTCAFAGPKESLGETLSTEEWITKISQGGIIYAYDQNHQELAKKYGQYKSMDLTFVDSETGGYYTKEYWDIKIIYENGYAIWHGVISFDNKFSRDAVPRKYIYLLRSDADYFKYLNNTNLEA